MGGGFGGQTSDNVIPYSGAANAGAAMWPRPTAHAVRDGDSGGFVFSCNGSRTDPRIARGMVSDTYLGDNGPVAFTWVESIQS